LEPLAPRRKLFRAFDGTASEHLALSRQISEASKATVKPNRDSQSKRAVAKPRPPIVPEPSFRALVWTALAFAVFFAGIIAIDYKIGDPRLGFASPAAANDSGRHSG